MYKIKSTVGEVKELCIAYLKRRKEYVKNRRVQWIHNNIDNRNFLGMKKFKSVKDVIHHMKNTQDTWGTIWSDLSVRGSAWESDVIDLFDNIEHLPDNREIWLQQGMSFLFKYKEN